MSRKHTTKDKTHQKEKIKEGIVDAGVDRMDTTEKQIKIQMKIIKHNKVISQK